MLGWLLPTGFAVIYLAGFMAKLATRNQTWTGKEIRIPTHKYNEFRVEAKSSVTIEAGECFPFIIGNGVPEFNLSSRPQAPPIAWECEEYHALRSPLKGGPAGWRIYEGEPEVVLKSDEEMRVALECSSRFDNTMFGGFLGLGALVALPCLFIGLLSILNP